MRVTVPQIEISKEEGFLEKDIFNRNKFGERLANLFDNSQEDMVVALDAQWGEGKSTFIKMWQGYVENHREKKFKTIYFDAFANDYQKDPFLALTAEMYGLLKDEAEEKKKEFRQKAGDTAKSMARGALKIGVRVATGGVLDGSIVDSVEQDISKLVAEQIDGVIADRLQSSEEDKSALKHFKEYLQEIAEEQGNGNPIIFIIDELDRCRPDFALELVEQIKHIFSVQGITFLLVLNRKQLEASVKARYGNDIDASLYLQKFVSIWLSLPRSGQQYDDNGEKYLIHALESMLLENEQFKNTELRDLLIDIVKLKKPSYREIERILSYVAILNNMLDNGKYRDDYQIVMAFICYLKVVAPIVFEKIVNNNIDFTSLLKESQFNLNNEIKNKFSYVAYMIKIIKFDFSDDTVRKQMIEDREIDSSSYRGNQGIFVQVANMLKTMENR
ncbi:MAG: P-loop NTPase fold protein [Sulfurimonadaceae bacterium]